jgi:hypothetical protein
MTMAIHLPDATAEKLAEMFPEDEREAFAAKVVVETHAVHEDDERISAALSRSRSRPGARAR